MSKTHKQRVLELLKDGKPHSYRAGYRLGVMLHSRVADLRRDGHDIRCWRDGDDYLYQLIQHVPLDETSPLVAPQPRPQLVSSSGPSPVTGPALDGESAGPVSGPLPDQLVLSIPKTEQEIAA